MNHLRYVVVRRGAEWKIVRAGRRYSGSYPSKRQALCAAIEYAEQDGHAGRRVEVLVRHEDGHFVGSSRVDLQACKLEYSIVSPK